MKKTRRAWLAGVAGCVVAAAVPAAARLLREPDEAACALDGRPIEPQYRVEIVDAGGREWSFCCVRCAELWLARRATPPRAVLVTDEAGGVPVEASSASFVRGGVAAGAAAGQVRAFRDADDAEEYMARYGGTLLSGAERPFRQLEAGRAE